MSLCRYWFKFELRPEDPHPPGVLAGCGVTAYSYGENCGNSQASARCSVNGPKKAVSLFCDGKRIHASKRRLGRRWRTSLSHMSPFAQR
jgi:hypothetical protein